MQAPHLSIRGRETAAPLKVDGTMDASYVTLGIRGRETAAPLKGHLWTRSSASLGVYPWS